MSTLILHIIATGLPEEHFPATLLLFLLSFLHYICLPSYTNYWCYLPWYFFRRNVVRPFI